MPTQLAGLKAPWLILHFAMLMLSICVWFTARKFKCSSCMCISLLPSPLNTHSRIHTQTLICILRDFLQKREERVIEQVREEERASWGNYSDCRRGEEEESEEDGGGESGGGHSGQNGSGEDGSGEDGSGEEDGGRESGSGHSGQDGSEEDGSEEDGSGEDGSGEDGSGEEDGSNNSEEEWFSCNSSRKRKAGSRAEKLSKRLRLDGESDGYEGSDEESDYELVRIILSCL